MKAFGGASGLRSMRARMTGLFALLVALLVTGVGWGVLRLERHRAQARVQESLELSVERMQDEIGEEENRGKPLLVAVRHEQGEVEAGGLALLVVDGDKVLWRSRRQSPTWPSPEPAWRFKTFSHGDQTLVAALLWTPEEQELRSTAYEIVFLGVLVVFATALIAWFVVGQTLSPISHLAQEAQNASPQGATLRLQPPSSDAEMLHLTSTLNSLLARLEAESRSRGRFYAAASHELRTPLQVLLGQIDVALARPRPAEEHEATLKELGKQTERLNELVASLLQLNALEMGQTSAVREDTNLAYWVERALDQQTQAMQGRELRTETRLNDVCASTPPAHLEVLLRNLLENAAKYATSGTTVRVQLQREGDGALLSVENQCSFPQGTNADQWFEPFFRADASRNSQTGGNGLGLSIVVAIARANDWKVDLQTKGSSIVASVYIPLMDERGVLVSNEAIPQQTLAGARI